MKGRKPIPTALKILNGNPGKRPLNEAEPRKVPGHAKAPDHLTPVGVAEYDRMLKLMDDMGMDSAAYDAAVAAYAGAYEQYLEAIAIYTNTGRMPVAKGRGGMAQNPLLGVINKHRDDLRKWLTEFGMTPSSATRIEIEKKADDLAKILA